MKNLKEIIIEKLKVGSKTKINLDQYEFHPKNKDELKELVDKLIKERGEEADLNDIDTSKITEMNALFKGVKFNGNISKWNVSNVKNMNVMFCYSTFTGENGDISEWDVSKVKTMYRMFWACPLEKNPPKWYKDE